MSYARLTIGAASTLAINGYIAKYRGTITGAGAIAIKGADAKVYGLPENYYAGFLFDVAAVNISGSDLSFASASHTINSVINFVTNNKILAPYTTLTFTKKPYVTGYSSTRYIVTPNTVTFNSGTAYTASDSPLTIPLGTTATSYTPASFTFTPSGNLSFSAKVGDLVTLTDAGGSSIKAGILNKKWTLFPGASGNIKITLGWNNTADELTGFNRSASFIAHSVNNIWTTSAPQAALLSGAVYTVNQTVPPSSASGDFIVSSTANLSPSLSKLTLSSGALSPAFTTATTSYSVSLPYAVNSIILTPVAPDGTTIIKINGATVASGTASGSIALNVGSNMITVATTSADGSATITYSVSVTRAPSNNDNLSLLKMSKGIFSPTFTSATTSYTDAVGNTITSVTVTPTTAGSNATVKVNGTTVASGTASGAINLNVGNNTISVVVTAQDGTTTKTYTVTVTRAPSNNDNLTSLKISKGIFSPAFASATTSYTDAVGNTITSVTVTPTTSDPTATVKVNGTAITSGTASGAINLNVGSNTINVVVAAQDGITTKTYKITVTRAPSTNDNLSSLKMSKGIFSPTFASGTTAYTDAVGNTITSVTVTPATTDATATVKVNGNTVISGTASSSINLAVGTNKITVTVVAQDGKTTKNYVITVTRAGNSNDNLTSLKMSKGTFSPTFASATTSYTDAVGNTITSVTVTPTASDPDAAIQVNGATVASGTASGAINLAVGANTINVVVTASDNVTTKTYTVTVNRASGGADSYDPGISVTKPTDTPILAEDGIQVHQAISPNGDGLNDFLQIDNIGQYPDNKLTIMNRNGQLIYEAKGYNNSSKTFDGHSNKNGQMQLPGTYFYQLDYVVNGITKHKTGFLVLKY